MLTFSKLVFILPTKSQWHSERPAQLNPVPMTISQDSTAVAEESNVNEVTLLDSRDSKIIKALKADAAIILQVLAVRTRVMHTATGRTRKGLDSTSYNLCVNIYGPRDLFDLFGAFATQCKMFLQDPKHCDRDVEYLHPHRMPFDEVVYTKSLEPLDPESTLSKIEFRQPQDLFRDFELDDDLAETSPPSDIVKSILQP